MKYIIALCILILMTCSVAWSADLGHWARYSPGGNWIDHFKTNDKYVTAIFCKQKRKLVSDMQQWSFYRGYIYGVCLVEDEPAFFIFDEGTCMVSYTHNASEFERMKTQKKLSPLFFERSYSSSWGYFLGETDWGPGISRMLFYIPLALLLTVISLYILIKSKLQIQTIWQKCSLAFLLLLIIRLLLDLYPHSI